jgi:hypothetical protein
MVFKIFSIPDNKYSPSKGLQSLAESVIDRKVSIENEHIKYLTEKVTELEKHNKTLVEFLNVMHPQVLEDFKKTIQK